MRKSIKKMVFYRVAAALLSILLFSGVTTFNLLRVKDMQERSAATVAVLSRAQSAEVAHYKWSANLSNALYADTEFTGSKDPTTCVLGQWLYGEAGTTDKTILRLRDEIEPLHKALHESADYVLNMKANNAAQGQAYYRETIQSNLSTLVGKLDQVIAQGTALNDESTKQMHSTIMLMQAITTVCLVLALCCLASLVLYVLKNRQRVLRVGITTSKKIGNAVQRNRARRVIREAFRPLAPEVHTGYDLVFVARGRTPFVKSTEVQAHLGRQLKAAGLWNGAEKAKSR